MALPTMMILVFGGLIVFILPLILWIHKNNSLIRLLVDILFIVYLIILVVGVFAKVNFDNVETIIEWDFSGSWANKKIDFTLSNIQKSDLIINLIMLVPMGMYIAFKSDYEDHVSLVVLVFVGLMVGLGIELFQFVLPIPRSVQLSDVLLNAVSVCLGGIAGFIINKITSFFRKS